MRTRILLYTDNPPIGGVHQFNHSLLVKLVQSRYQVTSVQIQESNYLFDYQKELGIEQFWLEPDLITGYARSYTDLDTPRTILSKIKPDLIIFSDGWPMANFAAKQVAIEMEIPYMIVVGFVNTSCATVNREDGIPYTEAARYHYTLANAFVAVSKENLALLHNLFKIPDRLGQVIHYGRPASFFTPPNPNIRRHLRQELNLPDDGIVCFTSARLAPVKGYDFQLDAIAQLRESPAWKNLYFIWAGSAHKGENIQHLLEHRIYELGVSDRVQFLGERQDIPELLEASDIYILPSRAEGMPLAIMEAMAKGLPVIASAVSGIPEELGETGKLLPDPNTNPEGTAIELVSTIQAWVMNSELRQAVGQACQQRAEQLFKEELMLNRYSELIDDILQSIQSKKQSLESSKVLTPEKIQILQNRINYACLVWEAWHRQSQGDLSGMYQSLQASSHLTPFLSLETIVNWLETFTRFSREKGQNLNVYSICKSPDWQRLLRRCL